MKKIKEFWSKKTSNQKKEFILRILKQALFALVCMFIGSLIGSRILLTVLACFTIPVLFTLLGYYLGKNNSKHENPKSNTAGSVPKKK